MKFEPVTLLIARDDEGSITTYGTGPLRDEEWMFVLGVSEPGTATLFNIGKFTSPEVAQMLRAAADSLLDTAIPKQTFQEEDE